jgi:hypothetical protein
MIIFKNIKLFFITTNINVLLVLFYIYIIKITNNILY